MKLTDELVMIPEQNISEGLAIFLHEANKNIAGITIPNWAPNFSLVWETIKDRIGKGVLYQRIADEVTLVSFGHLINQRDVKEVGVNLRVLPKEYVKEKIYIIDSTEAFIFWPPGPGHKFPLEASRTSISDIVNKCLQSFMQLWNIGIPYEKIEFDIENLRDKFSERCIRCIGDEQIRDFAETLFNYGKFFRKDYVTICDLSLDSIIIALTKAGLVISSPDDEKTIIPNIMGEVRSNIVKYMKSA